MHMHVYKNAHTRSSQCFEQEPTACNSFVSYRDWLIANLTDERMVRIQRMRGYSTHDLPESTIDQGESIVSIHCPRWSRVMMCAVLTSIINECTITSWFVRRQAYACHELHPAPVSCAVAQRWCWSIPKKNWERLEPCVGQWFRQWQDRTMALVIG